MEDVMRMTPRKLSEEDVKAMNAVKQAGNAFVEQLKLYAHPGRELSLAVTNAEQSVMWAVKGITG
jgi:hypothetical protein